MKALVAVAAEKMQGRTRTEREVPTLVPPTARCQTRGCKGHGAVRLHDRMLCVQHALADIRKGKK